MQIGSVNGWIAASSIIQVCQKINNIGYSWVNEICTCCSDKVLPLIQIHSVLFGGASPPWLHDDVTSSRWNVLLSECLPDKRHAISWSLGHRGCSLVLSCGNWRREASFGRSTGWLINILTHLWKPNLHSPQWGYNLNALAWSSCNFWGTLDSILKETYITYLSFQLKHIASVA